MGLRVVAAEAFGVGLIPTEDAGKRARCQLVRRRGYDIRITKATEDMEIII